MRSVLGHGRLFVIYFRYGALMIADVVSHFVIPSRFHIQPILTRSAYENGSRRRLFPAAREH